MPTSVGPNTKGEENLVFGYDLGDVSNSYKGEPTTNQYTNPDFSNGTTGWTFGSWDGNISYTTATVTGPYGKDVTALKLTKNASSAYSHFHQNNSGKYTTGNQYTLSAWVKGSGTLRGNSQWGGVEQSFVLTGDWQYINYTVTAPNDSSYPYWAAETLTTGTVMYMTYAQSEQKSHATPYVNGTRSATQGLLDLTGNSTIDLTNVSFDSNALPTWDGSNDYIGVTRRQYGIDEEWTTELVFKPTTTNNSWNGLFGGPLQNGGYWMFHSEGNLTYYEGYSGESGTKITYRPWNFANTFTQNEFHHLTIAYSPNTSTNGTFNLYYNGGEKIDSFSFTFTWSHSLDMQFIGAGDGRYGTNDIHYFKQYNRALTASEIKSNFNAIKGRFNI